jgi:hypothetical protein
MTHRDGLAVWSQDASSDEKLCGHNFHQKTRPFTRQKTFFPVLSSVGEEGGLLSLMRKVSFFRPDKSS